MKSSPPTHPRDQICVADRTSGRYPARVQTLDPIANTAGAARTSPAATRNTAPILTVLKGHLPETGEVLEIASGTGQHVAAFAAALPDLNWTPSDYDADARASIEAWRAQSGLSNIRAPLSLDMTAPDAWPQTPFDAIICFNMIHISPWTATKGLMALAGSRLPVGGLLALYGPYLEDETPLATSNADFDASLKQRNPQWGLRRREDVEAEARLHNLSATLRVAMPANNLLLLFRKL